MGASPRGREGGGGGGGFILGGVTDSPFPISPQPLLRDTSRELGCKQRVVPYGPRQELVLLVWKFSNCEVR